MIAAAGDRKRALIKRWTMQEPERNNPRRLLNTATNQYRKTIPDGLPTGV
jgi:hypothetical protein